MSKSGGYLFIKKWFGETFFFHFVGDKDMIFLYYARRKARKNEDGEDMRTVKIGQKVEFDARY